jgi:hypothetical protein
LGDAKSAGNEWVTAGFRINHRVYLDTKINVYGKVSLVPGRPVQFVPSDLQRSQLGPGQKMEIMLEAGKYVTAPILGAWTGYFIWQVVTDDHADDPQDPK